ncbi:hypothetical protein [Micromonospora globispora]|uniref:hypothetical protein n=1 Tax=Micromonospora globispora TaxID=1450148 RepID=UPI000F4E9473|nr:hypothetical protein [Micromonospora globispora]
MATAASPGWALPGRPSRFLPLTLGLYTILVLIPVMIASGGPPAPPALWTIGGWDMLWFLLSASLLRFTQRRSERPGNGKDQRSYLTAHPLIDTTAHGARRHQRADSGRSGRVCRFGELWFVCRPGLTWPVNARICFGELRLGCLER